jgi:hypothetical protein
LIGWEIKQKRKGGKQPKDWASYTNSTWREVDRENYWEFL